MSQSQKKFGIVLPIILLSYFMILLDNSIIFTSLVRIASDLHLDAQTLAWVSSAYTLTFGGFQLFGGRLGDVYGRKRIFLIGLLLFSFGSLMVGLSTNSWRYGFFLNVPVGLLMFILTIRYVADNQNKSATRLDIVGTILSVLGLSALLYSIDGTSHQLLALVAAVIALGLFVYAEHVIKTPIMPLRLFADRQRNSAYIARFFFIGGAFAYYFVTTQALQHIYGFTPLLTGLAFLPVTIPQFVGALQVSRLSSKLGTARLIVLADLLVTLSFLATVVLGIDRGYWIAIVIPMIIFGYGQGLVLSPLTMEGVANTDPEIAGAASGVVNTVHQFGQSVGVSVVIALTSSVHDFSASYHAQLLIIASIAGLSLMAALVLLADRNRQGTR